MTDRPSEALIELVARLGLATAGQVLSQSAHARRLAGDLPMLDTVWIDALMQARLLSPFQAQQIQSGRGEQLAVGPYVLVRPLGTLGFAQSLVGRHLETGASARVYVLARGHREKKAVLAELDQLILRSAQASVGGMLMIEAAGEDQGRIWAASQLMPAGSRPVLRERRSAGKTEVPAPIRSAAEWMVDNGRFPPPVVLYLAQRIVATLTEAESYGLVHGDLRTASLLCPEDGEPFLIHPGLRAVARPAEGYALADLPPEAFETLAPERIAAGSPPTAESDIYACGCLWWHLLAGRSPFAGGNSLARLQAVHAGKVPDIRRVAPDTPEPLCRAIEACLEHDPAERPHGFSALAEMIGPPTRRGVSGLARCLKERRSVRSVLGASAPRPKRREGRRRELLSTGNLVVAVLVLASISLLSWRRGDGPRRGASQPLAAVERSSALPTPAADNPQPSALASAGKPSGKTSDAKAKPATTAVAYWTADAVPPLVLPSDRTVELEGIVPRAGQTIRAAEGRRAHVVVSGRPAMWAVEGVWFENIDFVLDASATPSIGGGGTMFVVAAARIGFRGCTFEVRSGEVRRESTATAIAWRGPARSVRAAADWQGRLTLDRCALRGFGTAIDCPVSQRATLELVDSLVVNCATVARLAGVPGGEQACEVWLTHVTARQTGPLVRIDYEELPAAIGQLTIVAQESTLAPRRDEPLVLFAGPTAPESLIESLDWQGQGSLVTPETTIAARRFGQTDLDPVADEDLMIAGLVRSPVVFAGQSLQASADSRTVRWQGALQSGEPPGIDSRVP